MFIQRKDIRNLRNNLMSIDKKNCVRGYYQYNSMQLYTD